MFRDPKFLVVDDNAANRLFLVNSLHGHARHFDSLESGQDALDKFEQGLGSDKPYDVILLDIMMPGLDGVEVLARIRALEEEHEVPPNEEVKIIMISAIDNPEHHAKISLMRGGLNTAFIPKPVNIVHLIDRLRLLGVL